MNTKDAGIIAESAVLHELVKLGFTVSIPYGDNAPYDFIVETNDGLKKVQVKTAHLNDGAITATTTFRVGSKRRGYGIYSGIVDYIAVHCVENNTCYAIRAATCGSQLTLRTRTPANNQSTGIKYAADYLLSAIIK